jgi:hypothetical protein
MRAFLMRTALSLMAQLQSCSPQSGCGGGGGRVPDKCAFKPFNSLTAKSVLAGEKLVAM